MAGICDHVAVSELPPPSFPPPEPTTGTRPDGAPATPASTTQRDPNRTAVVAVLVAVAVLALAGFVFFVRGAGDAGSDTAVSFEQRWDERVPALAGGDEFDTVAMIGDIGGVVVLLRTDRDAGVVFGVDADTGEQLWDDELNSEVNGDVVARIVDDQLFVVSGEASSDDDSLTPGAGTLTTYDPRTGEVLWTTRSLTTSRSWVAVGDQLLAVTNTDDGDGPIGRRLVSIDRHDGEQRWERASTGGMPIVVRSNGLVLAERDGDDRVYVGVDLDGDERWSIDADTIPFGADWYPELSSDVVALVDGGDMIGVDLESGDERWSTARPDSADPLEVTITTRPDLDLVVSCVDADTDDGGEAVTIASFGIDAGELRWEDTIEGEDPAFFGIVGTMALTTSDALVGTPCAALNGFGQVADLTGRDAASGEVAWEVGPRDGESTLGLLLRRSTSFTAELDLFVFTRRDDTDEVIDLATGDVLGTTDLSDRDRLARQTARWGDTVVYFEITDIDDEGDDDQNDEATRRLTTVRDANDDTRAVAIDGIAVPVGFADGVFYVRSGSRLVAID